MESFLKRKKEAKKEKPVKMWITLRVTHILTGQTNNNNVLSLFIKNQSTFFRTSHGSVLWGDSFLAIHLLKISQFAFT